MDGSEPNVLDDGRYDAMVVDATSHGDGLALDLTILTGAHKGEVVSIRTTAGGLDGQDELDVLGMPGTLVVEKGVPAFTIER
ncbi:MAG TPA: hypothetical protein VGJ03_08605 [Acidimicrobiales bacterium]